MRLRGARRALDAAVIARFDDFEGYELGQSRFWHVRYSSVFVSQ